MGQKQPQKLKFLIGQLDPLSVRCDGALIQIHGKAPGGKDMLRRFGLAAPQHRLHP